MSVAAAPSTQTVALVGNPNTGKSTLFTALAGVRQRIGNYPGVTVEKKIGYLRHGDRQWALIDLPGTYSLSPHSPDEMVVVDVLLGHRDDVPSCDAIICIVDASNLERNLYLVSQVLELGRPTVVALNMIDIAEARGMKIDVARLSSRLGIPVVPIQANKHRGLAELKAALERAVYLGTPSPDSPFPPEFCKEVAALQEILAPAAGCGIANGQALRVVPRYIVERLLLDSSGYLEQSDLIAASADGDGTSQLHSQLLAARSRLAAVGCQVPAIEAIARYGWAGRMLEGVISVPNQRPEITSDKLDRFLTHRLWGTLTFAAVMFVLFSSIFIVARFLKSWYVHSQIIW